MGEGVCKKTDKLTYTYMYTCTWTITISKKVTHSHFYTLYLFFSPSVKDQTLLQAPQKMSILPNTALNGIACAFTHISKFNIIKIAQVSF